MPVGYPKTFPSGGGSQGAQRLSWSASEFCLSPDSVGPEYVFASGDITAVVVAVDIAPVGGSETWNVLVNGSTVGSIVLAATTNTASMTGVPFSVAQGDVVTVRPTGSLPPSPSQGVVVTALLEAS